MKKDFPIFETDSTPRCFKCSGELDDFKPSGFPKGLGEFRGKCSSCDMSTWFDLFVTKGFGRDRERTLDSRSWCGVCGGDGYLEGIDGEQMECPECEGTGAAPEGGKS